MSNFGSMVHMIWCSVDFAESSDPLEERWVRVIPTRIEPVIQRESQVVFVELNQSTSKVCRFVQVFCKGVGAELKATAQTSHEEWENLIQREPIASDEKDYFNR